MTTANQRLLIPILILGIFGILNTEMGVVGIIPVIAKQFAVSIPDAGWMVSVFALVVAVSAPVVPLLFSKMNRKSALLLALAVFVISNVIAIFAQSYTVQLLFRAIPAFFHPLYITLAFTVASASVEPRDAPKAVAKLFVGVSAGMVLGVPITSFIGSQWGYPMAMVFSAVVNLIVLLATAVAIPSMPVQQVVAPKERIGILKKPIVWLSILAVISMNAVMFGFYTYVSDYLQSVTLLSFKVISILLLLYGMANIVGNLLAGKLLATKPLPTLVTMPVLLFILYALLFAFGTNAILVAIVLSTLGVFVGIANNGNQYMVSTSAPEAPEFANGLFLTSANLGSTLGTFVCGLFIAGMGTRYSVLGAILFAVLGFLGIMMRNQIYKKAISSE